MKPACSALPYIVPNWRLGANWRSEEIRGERYWLYVGQGTIHVVASSVSPMATTLLAAVGRRDEEPLLGRITAMEYETHAGALTGAAARHPWSDLYEILCATEGDLRGALQWWWRRMRR